MAGWGPWLQETTTARGRIGGGGFFGGAGGAGGGALHGGAGGGAFNGALLLLLSPRSGGGAFFANGRVDARSVSTASVGWEGGGFPEPRSGLHLVSIHDAVGNMMCWG